MFLEKRPCHSRATEVSTVCTVPTPGLIREKQSQKNESFTGWHLWNKQLKAAWKPTAQLAASFPGSEMDTPTSAALVSQLRAPSTAGRTFALVCVWGSGSEVTAGPHVLSSGAQRPLGWAGGCALLPAHTDAKAKSTGSLQGFRAVA